MIYLKLNLKSNFYYIIYFYTQIWAHLSVGWKEEQKKFIKNKNKREKTKRILMLPQHDPNHRIKAKGPKILESDWPAYI